MTGRRRATEIVVLFRSALRTIGVVCALSAGVARAACPTGGIPNFRVAVTAQTDDADFVHQKRHGNSLQSKGLTKDVGRIDCNGVSDAKFLDVRPHHLRPLNINGDGQHLEILSAMFLVKSLPNWQIVAAPSPTCPTFNEHALAAKIGQ